MSEDVAEEVGNFAESQGIELAEWQISFLRYAFAETC